MCVFMGKEAKEEEDENGFSQDFQKDLSLKDFCRVLSNFCSSNMSRNIAWFFDAFFYSLFKLQLVIGIVPLYFVTMHSKSIGVETCTF